MGRPAKTVLAAAAVLAVGLVLAAFTMSGGYTWMKSSAGGSMMGDGGMMGGGSMMGGMMSGISMTRHHYVMRNGIPPQYAGKENPLTYMAFSELRDPVVREGATLYADNCAACHGPEGLGDGETGVDLDPRPANLVFFMPMPLETDPFLLWTVSDGGEVMDSDMPAFKEILSEDEIWKIVAYLRTGLPQP